MFRCGTMEQLNRKTKDVKNRGVFTTNWYLYKTHLHASPKFEGEKKTMIFEEFLLEAIDEGLSVLGESAKQAVYCHLGKTFKITRQDIPYRLEEFTDAIEGIFGAGAKILEIQIMKCLFKKVGYTFKNYPRPKDLTFTEYIAAVKLEKNNYEKISRKNSQTQTASRMEKR